MGGETGPDLTRSQVVAEDVKGDKIGPVVRSGRPEKGMPATQPVRRRPRRTSSRSSTIRSARRTSLEGNRRTVDVADLQTGNAQAGEQYFNGAGGCAKCHTPTGDFAGLATRLQGLQLMQRMLYPSGRGRGGRGRPPYTPTVTVTPRNGTCGHRPAGLSGRVHDRAHRRGGLVPILADVAGEVRRRRQARGARRAAAEVHGRRHAQRAGVPADAEVGAGARQRRSHRWTTIAS